MCRTRCRWSPISWSNSTRADRTSFATVYGPFPHPEWKLAYDAIHDQAVASGRSLLDRAATDMLLMLGYHGAYPGLGHAERRDQGCVFVPAA
jgi:hypothetical protein